MNTLAQNWPTKLAYFIAEKRHQPFVWGVNDCCMFACDWIAMAGGVDPADVYRMRPGQEHGYTSALGAMRILKPAGGVEAIVSTWCESQGWEEVALTRATRGFLVTVDTKHGPAAGVCDGKYSLFPGPTGITFVLTSKCHRAWRTH